MRKRLTTCIFIAASAACTATAWTGTPDLQGNVTETKEVIVVESASHNAAESPALPEDEKVFEVAEQNAQFPGGNAALFKWIAKEMRYPQAAAETGTQGRVIVRFVIEKDGSISNPVIVRSVDKELDAEAIRLVNKMPRWQPGKNNGKTVRSYYTLPVVFRLQ